MNYAIPAITYHEPVSLGASVCVHKYGLEPDIYINDAYRGG